MTEMNMTRLKGSVPEICSHRRQTVCIYGLVTAATSTLDFRNKALANSRSFSGRYYRVVFLAPKVQWFVVVADS